MTKKVLSMPPLVWLRTVFATLLPALLRFRTHPVVARLCTTSIGLGCRVTKTGQRLARLPLDCRALRRSLGWLNVCQSRMRAGGMTMPSSPCRVGWQLSGRR